MTALMLWEERVQEEAHLFNPAFCSLLTYEFIKSFTKAAEQPSVYLPLVFCALPVSLHFETRQKLPTKTATSLYTWLQRHPDVLVGFAIRAQNIAPYIKEGISFGCARNTLVFDEYGLLALGLKRAGFTPRFLKKVTPEFRDIVMRTQFLGRWFAGAGATSTILASWRITV